MKKIAAPIALGLLALALAPAMGQMQTMSQSVDNMTVQPGTISCNTGATPPQYHVVNSYWRAYDLPTEGVTIPIDVTCIRFGVEFALAGTGGEQPMEVRLYTQPSPGTFPTVVPTVPVHTEMFMLPDTSNMTSPIFVAGLSSVVTVQPNETLIVELYLPNGVPSMNVMFPGSNGSGETAPSYISAAGCAIATPSTMATIGFPNIHLILDVVYIIAGGFLPPTVSVNIVNQDPLTGMTEFTLSNGDLIPGHEIWNFYSFQVCTSGPYMGLCFSNPAQDLYPQLNTPLGFEPLHYIATGCSKTMGPFFLPTGPSVEIVPVDFDSVNGILYSNGTKITVTF